MTPEGVSIAHPEKLFIGGRWVAAASGRSIDIISPNSEKIVARVAEANEADVDAAVAAAREAFDRGPWPTTARRAHRGGQTDGRHPAAARAGIGAGLDRAHLELKTISLVAAPLSL